MGEESAAEAVGGAVAQRLYLRPVPFLAAFDEQHPEGVAQVGHAAAVEDQFGAGDGAGPAAVRRHAAEEQLGSAQGESAGGGHLTGQIGAAFHPGSGHHSSVVVQQQDGGACQLGGESHDGVEPAAVVGELLIGMAPAGFPGGGIGQGVVELGQGAGKENQTAARKGELRQVVGAGVGEKYGGPWSDPDPG